MVNRRAPKAARVAEVTFVAQCTESAFMTLVRQSKLVSPLVKGAMTPRRELLTNALGALLHRACQGRLTMQTREHILRHWVRRNSTRALQAAFGKRATTYLPPISRVIVGSLAVDLTEVLRFVLGRMQQLAAIQSVVHVDPEIQGRCTVFRGTRLPVAIALGRLDAGESFESLHEDYPYLTLEKLKLARLYLDIIPAPSFRSQ